MMHKTTIVTALYDIKRETEGDGRRLEDYFVWFEKTLQLNANFVVYIQDSLIERFKEIIKPNITNIIIYSTRLQDIPYYKYKDIMDEILQLDEYKKQIIAPSRIECKLSLYNIIQYSKLEWIKKVIQNNPFHSDYFFWMDAGCSRFFENTNLQQTWPDDSKLLPDKIIIQARNDIYTYNNWNGLQYDAVNLLCGTLFGGYKNMMLWLCEKVKELFETLLSNNIVNNEQIALAIIWKNNQDKFSIYINNTHSHLPLFKELSSAAKY